MTGDVRLAVFDCDGTLVDSQAMIVATARQAWESFGMAPPPDAMVRRQIGLPLQEAFRRLQPDLEAVILDRLVEAYRERFAANRAAGLIHEPLFPGIRQCLEALAGEGWLLGLATGKSLRGVRSTLGAHGLLDMFVTVQTADVAAGKPSPDMLLRALAETGADARATAMIGDTTFDMQMARSAKTRAVGVTWGYHDEQELWTAGAEAIVSAGEATTAVLSRMMEER